MKEIRYFFSVLLRAILIFYGIGFAIRGLCSMLTSNQVLFSNDGPLGIFNSDWFGFSGHEFPNGSVTVFCIIGLPFVIGICLRRWCDIKWPKHFDDDESA